MRRAAIDEKNRYMLKRQRQYCMAADVVTDAWMAFAEMVGGDLNAAAGSKMTGRGRRLAPGIVAPIA